VTPSTLAMQLDYVRTSYTIVTLITWMAFYYSAIRITHILALNGTFWRW